MDNQAKIWIKNNNVVLADEIIENPPISEPSGEPSSGGNSNSDKIKELKKKLIKYPKDDVDEDDNWKIWKKPKPWVVKYHPPEQKNMVMVIK
jgi:hypothetical protein